ncbi:D-amino-acid dehydrogenase [Dyadobacter jejuensis]|uniref:D-amino-acid dehydrogenase n=1 Tax=Dyadobacter jejuensis TaxID=1082580 RepID=A0A316BCM3_9BACT|nr:FAD-dependent oxidoreductase [Dyadobacter jejuensis]PWJ60207.1 D-amino-acid dehydrogenase [Dyadobacter jejuensis]
MGKKGTVLVIGGGIMGLSSAYYLLKDGWQVTVLDKGDFTDNASQGNAGMLVPSHFVPMAAPGMVSKGIRWMFDSKSPFYVKPALSWSLASWGLQFMRSATEAQVQRASVPLRDYHLFSQQLYNDLQNDPEFDFKLQHKGILMLFKSVKAGEEEWQVAQKASELGLDVALLNGKEVQALEPHARLEVLGAAHYRCDAHLDPSLLCSQLLQHLRHKGVELRSQSAVTGFSITEGVVREVATNTNTYQADLVVMTAGAWLPDLARKAGLKIPVMPGKGYSILEPLGSKPMLHPSLLVEAKVAVTPFAGFVRFGGTMELGAMDRRINMKRVEGILGAVPNYYPDFRPVIPPLEKIWFGYRPCSPDGLPYLGYARGLKNLIVAGGHGMMGVSLGLGTGQLVAQLAMGQRPSVDLSLYAPDRFQ